MTFERLDPTDWPRLAPVFREEFGTEETPDPETTEIYAELEGERPMRLFMLETVKHMTLWVAPHLRGQGRAREMAEEALRLTRGVEGYISATKPETVHLAESLGLTKINGALYCKEKNHVR